MSMRRMGKASFFHVQDSAGRIQVYLKKDDLGAAYDAFRLLDIGDIVGVEGFVFRTRTGEVSIHAGSFQLLAKSLRPLPVVKEKTDEAGNTVTFDPFADKELRYRQRYVDLAVNPAVREVFVKRSNIYRSMRKFLDARGYLEVETPILQPLYGGAFARPFVTHHNALDIDLYLRVAPELHLKRLIVGGLERVYEIGRCFRNEGIDYLHNPEFTSVEFYQAYADYNDLMTMVEEMLPELARAAGKDPAALKYGDDELSLVGPYPRIAFRDAVLEATGIDLDKTRDRKSLEKEAKKLKVEVAETDSIGTIMDSVFKKLVRPSIVQPTFITEYPIELSPLAKKKPEDPRYVERFQLLLARGFELTNAFSELNDPLDQEARFKEQSEAREAGDEEAQRMDDDFVTALKHGMPPTAGLGMGIDRLIMLLTDSHSIKEVILFPTLRPTQAEAGE